MGQVYVWLYSHAGREFLREELPMVKKKKKKKGNVSCVSFEF